MTVYRKNEPPTVNMTDNRYTIAATTIAAPMEVDVAVLIAVFISKYGNSKRRAMWEIALIATKNPVTTLTIWKLVQSG